MSDDSRDKIVIAVALVLCLAFVLYAAFSDRPFPFNGPGPRQSGPTYIINGHTGRFHRPDCEAVAEIAPQNYDEFYGDRIILIEDIGLTPCVICKP